MAATQGCKITVGIRIKPTTNSEESANITWKDNNNTVFKLDKEKKLQHDVYQFDHVFNENCCNDKIFRSLIKPIVDKAVEGENATILAYGPTSSGKTYTMMGTDAVKGIVPLTIDYIFEIIKQKPHCRNFLLGVSFVEIYNGKVRDLLRLGVEDGKKETNVGGVKLNCVHEIVNDPAKMHQLLKFGNKLKEVGITKSNDTSSRSHTIFTIKMKSQSGDIEFESHINLVDLAGSERASETESALRRKEGCAINVSLLQLGNAIRSLKKGGFVDYRSSILTKLLQQSLSGDGNIAFVCNITAVASEQTASAIGFAQQIKNVKPLPPKLNVKNIVDAALLKQQIQRVKELEVEVSQANKLQEENEELKKQLDELRKKDVTSHHVKMCQEIIRRQTLDGALDKGQNMFIEENPIESADNSRVNLLVQTHIRTDNQAEAGASNASTNQLRQSLEKEYESLKEFTTLERQLIADERLQKIQEENEFLKIELQSFKEDYITKIDELNKKYDELEYNSTKGNVRPNNDAKIKELKQELANYCAANKHENSCQTDPVAIKTPEISQQTTKVVEKYDASCQVNILTEAEFFKLKEENHYVKRAIQNLKAEALKNKESFEIDYSILKDSLHVLQNKNQELEKEKNILENKLHSSENVNKHQMRQIKDLSKKLEKAEKCNSNNDLKTTEQIHYKKDLEDKLKTAEDEITKLKEEIKNKDKELDEILKNTHLREQNKNSQKDVVLLEVEMLKKKADKLNRKLSLRSKSVSPYQKKELNQELHACQSELKDKEDFLQDIEKIQTNKKIIELEKDNKRFQKAYESCLKRLPIKNLKMETKGTQTE